MLPTRILVDDELSDTRDVNYRFVFIDRQDMWWIV